jgi:hypothetical protein
MRTAFVFVFAVLLVASASVVSAQTESEGIHISDVNVSPETPQVGETVTLTTTVKNDGETRFDLSEVRLIRWDESSTVGTTNLGTVAPGEEIQVPLTTEFDTEGTKQFEVRASGKGSGIGTVQYPVSVEVGRNRVDVDASSDPGAVGAWNPVSVEVSNGGAGEIRGVTVTADGYGFTTERDGFLTNLSAGETETVDVLVSSDTSGQKDVTALVSYTNGDGNSLTVEDTTTVRFEELDHDLSLRASTSENGIEATVANLGNAAVQDVHVRGDAAVSPADVGDVDARSSETVEMNVTGVERERTVELTATYELGGERRTETTTVEYTPRSNVRLTGTSVEGASTLTITGSASNVGVEDAEGVVVEVADTPNVEPASPQSDYFVGTVPASDFGTFELNARVTGNVSKIPVVVSYVADGDSVERVQNVTYTGAGVGTGAGAAASSAPSANQPPSQEARSGGSSGVPSWIFVALAALVVGVVAYGWRKRG